METVNIYDAMHVSFSDKYRYPFNLKFERTIKDNRVKGPGVYVICFKGNPVYFGKYQPLDRNNIFDDRWLRHIKTITLRGERVGFGSKSRVLKVLPMVCDELKTILRKLLEDKLCDCLKDTGVCTSYDRIVFASQNWQQFSAATPENILDDFEFHYFKIGGIQNDKQAKEVTSYIEDVIINEFYFPVNKDKGRIKPQSMDCIESRVLELIQILDLELELHLNLSK